MPEDRATNPFGVEVDPLGLDAGSPGSPTGVTKTYHGATIIVDSVGGRRVVGRITSWQPTAYSREGVHVYELSHKTWGRPVDYVPGKATGFTIALVRTEVWFDELEIALGLTQGTGVFRDLMDQVVPFSVKEELYRGDSGLYRTWIYEGCWFQEKNSDAYSADGDARITVNATLAYVSRKFVSNTGAAGLG